MSTTCQKQFHIKLNHMDVTKKRSQHQIKNGDIILTYIGMLKVTMKSLNSITHMMNASSTTARQRMTWTWKDFCR